MKNGDRPAFPEAIPDSDGSWSMHDGLTKRELFSAMAMQSVVATHVNAPAMGVTNKGICLHPPTVANWSIEYADALLAELEKKTQ